MSKEISNSQIENALKNMEDEDINNNFVSVFPSNHMNKFINHAAMISGKKGNVYLSFQILTALARVAHTGGAYSILNLKLTSSFSILVVSMVCNILSSKMIRKLLKKPCSGLKK